MESSPEELWEAIKRGIPIKTLANMLQEQRNYQEHVAIKAHALLCHNPACKMHSPGKEGEEDMAEWMKKVAELASTYTLTFQEINALIDLAMTIVEDINSSESPAFLMDMIAKGYDNYVQKLNEGGEGREDANL